METSQEIVSQACSHMCFAHFLGILSTQSCWKSRLTVTNPCAAILMVKCFLNQNVQHQSLQTCVYFIMNIVFSLLPIVLRVLTYYLNPILKSHLRYKTHSWLSSPCKMKKNHMLTMCNPLQHNKHSKRYKKGYIEGKDETNSRLNHLASCAGSESWPQFQWIGIARIQWFWLMILKFLFLCSTICGPWQVRVTWLKECVAEVCISLWARRKVWLLAGFLLFFI